MKTNNKLIPKITNNIKIEKYLTLFSNIFI